MINPRELSVGSFLYSKKFKIVVSLELQDFFEAEIYANGSNDLGWFNENLEAIELNEKWLINAGFERYKTSGYFRIEGNKYYSGNPQKEKQGHIVIKLTKAGNFRVENFGNKTVYLKYLHQLQNLYSVIKGTDLEIEYI